MILTLIQSFVNAPSPRSMTSHGLTLDKALSIESSDERFIYCFNVTKLAAFFCHKSVSLRQGLFIISVIEIVAALYAIISLSFIDSTSSAYHIAFRVMQAQGVVIGTICGFAARDFSAYSATIVYHWKIWEPYVLAVLQINDAINEITDLKKLTTLNLVIRETLESTLVSVIRIFYSLYVVYILYSFIHLMQKGNEALVQYGPAVISDMERVRAQAATMELYPEGVEMAENSSRAMKIPPPTNTKS